MGKFSLIKNISLIIALVVVVYLIANYSGMVKDQIFQMLNIPGSSVKGASTERAQEISTKFQSDLGTQFGVLQEQALHVTLSDAIDTVARLQRVPRDFQAIQEYTTNKIENFIQK